MNEKPIRIQLSRKKGWRMPANTVKVTRPGIFGNPYTVEEFGSSAVEFYDEWIAGCSPQEHFETRDKVLINLHKLRGKNLACWCKLSERCHADILLKIANE